MKWNEKKRKQNKINIITTGEYRHKENIKQKTNPDHQIIKVWNYTCEWGSNVAWRIQLK